VPAEVVVVDASPTDETEQVLLEIADSSCLPFELIYVRSPKGLTRQRNAGIDISTRQIAFFLDDDALPMGEYFAEVRQVFIDDAAEEIGAVGVCATNEMNKRIPLRWRIRHALRLVPRNEPFIYNDVGTSAPSALLRPFTGVRDVDLFPGYAFAVRRQIFDSLRFSEFFDGYSYGEDVEMSLRIRQNWRVVNCGDARLIHNVSPGGRPAAYDKGRMEVRNRYFIWRRYSSAASTLDKLRFHADLCFLVVIDLAWFLGHPWKRHHLSHALGLLSGAVSCVKCAPECQERKAHRQYCLEAVESSNGGLTWAG
jgi:glycosyltransferase involved in cell wall biosynthesis